jgi:methionyl-tRNA formyltransferase
LRLIFAGTPEFARVALEQLRSAGHDIVLVLTQPDRPAGRGMKLHPSPVKQYAQAMGIPLAQPRSLRLDGKYPEDAELARAALLAARADAMIVAAYGLILPQWVLDLPALGCLNIHGSLLPRWRGAAPIHRAIEAGDRQTGVTIMQMDAGLDTGDMLLMQAVPVPDTATTASLHDQLAALGGSLIVQAVAQLRAGGLNATPQPAEGVTYAHKIEKHEAVINWAWPADLIARRVRAFNPFPGATSTLAGDVLKVWSAQAPAWTPAAAPTGPVHRPPAPGELLAVKDDALVVAAGQGVLLITEVQRPGGKRLAVADFLRGCKIEPGLLLGGN